MKQLKQMPEGLHGHKRKLLFFIACIEKMRKQKGLKPSEVKILDMGCGNGTQVSLPLGEMGYTVLAQDFHKPSIAYAKKHNPYANLRFDTIDIMSEDFVEKFHVVICSDVLQHVDLPANLVGRIKTILLEDGLLLISIPNGYGPFEIENYLIRIGILGIPKRILGWIGRKLMSNRNLQDEIPYNSENGHVQFFTYHKFQKMLHEEGFEIVTFKKICFMGAPFSAIFLSRVKLLIMWNLGMAHILPAFLCSQWAFEAQQQKLAG